MDLRLGMFVLCALLSAGCGSSSPPVIQSFAAEASAVHVGERTRLKAVFVGDSASIDGIGPVESGVPVNTPALARTRTFTLLVHRGSQQAEARLSVAATYRDRFRQLAPAPVAYTEHVAMALADGGALVMGGNTSESPNVPDTDTSLRFDPTAETMSRGPVLAFSAMAGYSLPVEIDGGGVFLVGGGMNAWAYLGEAGLRATQVYDAAAGRFNRAADLNFSHHTGGTATALADGGILVVGGGGSWGISKAERFDPASGRWAAIESTPRLGHTATRLADGRVLIAGGIIRCDTKCETLSETAEIYDPVSGRFEATGSLQTARQLHAAALLADGRVLVTGGYDSAWSEAVSAEIYDPSTGLFSPAGAMQVGRVEHSAIRLADGRVLVLGDTQASTTTDIFEPTANRWQAGPAFEQAWRASTATLLQDGRVLLFGGEDAQGFPVSTVLIYE